MLRRPDQSRLLRTALLGMLMLNAVLGYTVVANAKDLSRIRSQAAATSDLQALTDRVGRLEQGALVEIPAIVQVTDDVKRLKSEVFGSGSTFLGGGLGNRLDELEQSLKSVQSCVNRLASDLLSGSRFPVRC